MDMQERLEYQISKALNKNDMDQFELLLKNCDLPQENKFNILCHMIDTENVEVIGLSFKYIDNIGFVDSSRNTLLHDMIRRFIHTSRMQNETNRLEILELVLNYTKDVNYKNCSLNTALYVAVYNCKYIPDYMSVIEKLLKYGADPCLRPSSSIEKAISFQKYDIVKLFLGYLNKSFYRMQFYYLRRIIRREDYDMLELLLPYIKNINGEYVNKRTILETAKNAEFPNNDIIELLLEYGAR